MKKAVSAILIITLLVMAFILSACGESYNPFSNKQHQHYYIKTHVKQTCTHEGYTLYRCKNCMEQLKEDIVPPLTEGGHNYVNYICEYCDDFAPDEAPYTEGLKYEKITDKDGNESYAVTGIDSKDVRYIKIPSQHEGLAVTQIGDAAFKVLLELKHVFLPDSIVSIGDEAFQYCYNLLSINIPAGVTSIGEGAFWNCGDLKNISLASITEINDFAFVVCQSFTSIQIPEGVTIIGVGSLQYCDNLTSITIPVSMEYICHAAFWHCKSLQDVYYNGTIQQWQHVIKEVGIYSNTNQDASWNAYTNKFTVHCSDGDLEIQWKSLIENEGNT